MPDSMNVFDGVADLSAELFFIKLHLQKEKKAMKVLNKTPLAVCTHTHTHLDQLKWEALMEDAVDPRTTRKLGRVDLVPGPLDTLVKVHRELLHHPAGRGAGNIGTLLSLNPFPSLSALTAAEPWSCETGRRV